MFTIQTKSSFGAWKFASFFVANIIHDSLEDATHGIDCFNSGKNFAMSGIIFDAMFGVKKLAYISIRETQIRSW